MITGIENLRFLFNIFHDGGIVHYAQKGCDLELDIEIMYLAERVNADYRTFRLTLEKTQLVFETWPKDITAKPARVSAYAQIFHPELEILGAEIEGDVLNVACNQSSVDSDYCGGNLLLRAESAIVADEGGKSYSIEELQELCRNYWEDWKNKKPSPLPQPFCG